MGEGKNVFYLIKIPNTNTLCIFQDHPDHTFVVRFHSQLHGKVPTIPNQYLKPNEFMHHDTTLAHLKNCIVAMSDDYDQLVGAAVIEVL